MSEPSEEPPVRETPRTDRLVDAFVEAIFLHRVAGDKVHLSKAELSNFIRAHANNLERAIEAAEQRHAECKTLLEGEHDAHMECHRKMEVAEDKLREAEKFPAFYVARFDLAMKELGFDRPDPDVMGEVWCDIYEMAKAAIAAGKEWKEGGSPCGCYPNGNSGDCPAPGCSRSGG